MIVKYSLSRLTVPCAPNSSVSEVKPRISENRMVAVHSDGIIEALKDLYKDTRLSDELINGKLMDVETPEKAGE